jgi:hypothetical protein
MGEPVSYIFGAPAVATFIAALLALAVAVMGARRRALPGGAEFSLMMCAVFIWALTSGFGSAATRVDQKVLWAVLGYVGSIHVSPLFLLFALRYRKHSWKPVWWQLIGLWLIPAATLGLAATNKWHRLIWTSFTPGRLPGSNVLVFGHGPWFYVAVAYYATLGVVAAVIIGRAAWSVQRMFVRQTVILLVGLLVPWIFSALYILPHGPFPGLDLPPIGFAITGLLVLDAWDRVVDVNPAARAFMGTAEVIGRRVEEIPGTLGAAIAGLRAQAADHVEVSLSGNSGLYVDVRLSPLVDRDGSASGSVLVIHDLSERRARELDREELITELRTALLDIKTLRGLLPICASCKKIRDDKGSWGGLERYITEHSDAQFSHDICPDRMRKLYPDFAR